MVATNFIKIDYKINLLIQVVFTIFHHEGARTAGCGSTMDPFTGPATLHFLLDPVCANKLKLIIGFHAMTPF